MANAIPVHKQPEVKPVVKGEVKPEVKLKDTKLKSHDAVRTDS
jgi:hypothetical protein